MSWPHVYGEAIRRYWAKRGYEVNVTVGHVSQADLGFKTSASITTVRSDLVGGMPKAMGGVWRPIQATFGEGDDAVVRP